MKNPRTIVCICFVLASVAFVPLIWAKGRTAAQQKAATNCDNKFQADLERCRREHPELSERECTEASAKGWHVCMENAGLAREAAQGPKTGSDQPTVQTGSNGGKSGHPLHHIDGSTVPVTTTTTTKASPSPSPKPKPSRSPSGRSGQ